ncbi:energy transducer TonB [Rufibacter glacialis]|nr:energy transducer TonB [Rufibacter glacialis]GGK66422.1 cell envelope biogenesis protein TonB [Rufibacter glacialis]
METNPTYLATLDDYVFEGRNKAYGAYVLRKLYHRHLSQAVLYAITLFVIAFSLPSVVDKLFGKKDLAGIAPKKKVSDWVTVNLPKVEEIKEAEAVAPAAAKPSGPTVKNVAIKVVEETKAVVEEIPSQDQLRHAASGTVTSEGSGEGNVDNPEPAGGSGTGAGTGSGAESTPAPAYFISVEQMPQFEGGLSKLMEFVGKNLRYPNAAQANGVEGTVVLSFVVGATGDITDIQVLKGLGYGTEEEAIRVMKKVPRWKPGMQNGRAVPVRMTLPIRLELK